MSAFGGLILTNRGRILQAKAQTGVQLQYTRIALGDGTLGNSQIIELNALKKEIISLPIGKLKINGATAIVGTVLNNNDLSSGFFFREIGVFATDPDMGEVLYCYGNAGNLAEYIPAGGGADIVEKSIDIQVLTGNAPNVSAIIDQSLIFETPEGAQQKADEAEGNAKDYTDQQIAALPEPTPPEAENISIANEDELFIATNVEDALAELKQDDETHKADKAMHGRFDMDGKTYQGGFKPNVAKDGLIFVYEEV